MRGTRPSSRRSLIARASGSSRTSPSSQGTLGGEPLLRIGDGQADTTALYQVRGGVLADRGAIILANSGLHEIIYFSGRGELVRRIGRDGDGPGEFRAISWLQARVDGGVHVGDSRTRRVSAFAADGALLWSRPFNPPAESALAPNALSARGFVLFSTDDGRFLAFPTAVALPDGVAGLLPLVGDLRLYEPDQSMFSERGSLTVITWYEDPSAGSIPLGNLLGGSRMEYSGHSGRMAYSEGTAFQIDVLDDGARTIRIRERRPRIPFEPDSVPEGYAFVADSIPAYQDIIVDSRHRVWARAAIDNARTEWRVFGSDGSAVGSIVLPDDAEVLDASESRLLLLRRDDLGVESVELWELLWTGL